MDLKVGLAFLVTFIFSISLLIHYSNSETENNINILEEIIKKEKEGVRHDGYIKNMTLPKGAEELSYLGNGWSIFKLNNNCFLLGDHGSSSKMSTIKCEVEK